MRFIDKNVKDLYEDDIGETWFNCDGKEISSDNESFFAKIIEKNGKISYYVRTYDNSLFDPEGVYSRLKNTSRIKLNKVSKNTFEFYLLYLNTKNNIYFSRAERGYLNE